MGLNISLYRVRDMAQHQFEEDPRFDFLKYAGDEEFSTYTSGTWNFLYCPNPYCCDWIFRRPIDFEASRRWIKEHIPAMGQKRLLDAVEWMKQDKDLWLYFGY